MRPGPSHGIRTRARRRPDRDGSGRHGKSVGKSFKQRFESGSPGCLAAFFSVFLLFGLGFLWLTLIGPALGAWRARSWVATDCVVESSWVETHSGDDGNTYSVEVAYRYVHGGHEYHSERYDFFTGSTGGYEGKARVVERYPPGHLFTCWVDPEDPSEAVIRRGLGVEALFSLFPLIFVVVGAGGMAFALRGGFRSRRRRKAEGRDAGAARSGTARAPMPVGPVALDRGLGPVGKFFGLLAIAAFWNGITGVFVWQAIEGWRAGSPDGCLTLFILPFVAIGLVLLIGIPHQLLAMANPRPHLTLSPGAVPAGGSAELSWRFTRAAGRLRALKIVLEQSETRVTRSSGETSTKATVLHTETVYESEDRAAVRAGTARFTVPHGARPTDREGDRRITWKLKVGGAIRFWPDVDQDFEIEVLPPDPEAGPPIPPPPEDVPVDRGWVPPPAPLPPIEPR